MLTCWQSVVARHAILDHIPRVRRNSSPLWLAAIHPPYLLAHSLFHRTSEPWSTIYAPTCNKNMYGNLRFLSGLYRRWKYSATIRRKHMYLFYVTNFDLVKCLIVRHRTIPQSHSPISSSAGNLPLMIYKQKWSVFHWKESSTTGKKSWFNMNNIILIMPVHKSFAVGLQSYSVVYHSN